MSMQFITALMAAVSAGATALVDIVASIFGGVGEILFVSGDGGGLTIIGALFALTILFGLVGFAVRFVLGLVRRKRVI